MGNGSTKHGDAIADHEHDEWSKLERELEIAERVHERAAAEREAAAERQAARGSLESLPDWDLEEITGAVAKATLDGVRAGRDLRSKRVEAAHDTPIPPSWRDTARGKAGIAAAVVAALGAIATLVKAIAESGLLGP